MNNAIYTALYGRLSAGTALTSLIGGTTNPRIYHDMAKEGTPFPYVLFSWAAGGLTPTSPHVDGNGILYIRAFSKVDDSEAGRIRNAVFDLLDRQPLTVTGWSNSWLAAESPHIELPQTDPSGKIIWSNGDHYRIIIDKS